MYFKTSGLLALGLVSQTLAHCVITSITGANGVTMPGLTVIDGTPRDCPSARCGAQADTAVIRSNGPPLGRTSGGGPVNAASAVSTFMGTAAPARHKRTVAFKMGIFPRQLRDRLGGLLGGATGGAAGGSTATGTKTPAGTVEGGVASSAGQGASSGLPSVGADGVIKMVMHQVNQDGAGPMIATIDPTSGGTSESAFRPAQMLVDVPAGIAGFSATTTTDFPIQVQMPAGMVCSGTVAGIQNVCIVRVRNSTPAGPFGGSAAFTQQNASAAKRDVEIPFRA